jgi:hypothetical protein
LRDHARRASWWTRVDQVLARLRRFHGRPHRDPKLEALAGSPRWLKALDAIEQAIRDRIPRPRRMTATKLAEARTRAEADQRARAALIVPACWTTLNLAPGSSYPALKKAYNDRLVELNRAGAPLAEFQVLDQAFKQCLALLQTPSNQSC